MSLNLKKSSFINLAMLISMTLLIVACGVGGKNETPSKSTKAVNEINVGSKTVFLPEEFSIPTVVTGDFNGKVVSAGDNGEVAGFVAGRPLVNASVLSRVTPYQRTPQVLSSGAASAGNADIFLTSIEDDIATLGATTNISKLQPQHGVDIVIAQYQMTLITPSTVTDLSNSILTTIALNTDNGSVDNLPVAPTGAGQDTVFRLAITIKYVSQSEVLMLVSVTSGESYSAFSSLVLALGDSSNIGNVGDTLVQVEDDFIASDVASMSDFLFVVDNSGSMSGEQNAVSEAAQTFFDAISATGTDFQIGVITTDSMDIRGGEFTNDLTTFQGNILAGTGGSGTETGIWFAERALQSIAGGDIENGTVTVSGIPRVVEDQPIASLSVIILSDEPSQYNRVSTVAFDPNDNLFINRDYKVYAIVDPAHASFSQYDDLATVSGGSTASILDSSAFPAIMELIANNATGAASRYRLSQMPVSGSIVVQVNGVEMDNSNVDGWQYRAASNSIVFFGSNISAGGVTVEVIYDRIKKQSLGEGVSLSIVAGEVVLTWDAVEDVTEYRIYWSTTTGVTPTINGGTFSTSDLTYTHSGLTSNVTYFYVVTAIINGQESEPSIELVGIL